MIEELPDDIAIDDDLDDVEPVGDEAQLYEHFRVVVDRGQEMMRVDKYLFDRLTNASRNRIQKSAEAGFVMANNKPVKSSYKVKPMDVITIMMDRPRYENEVIPEDIPLNIVYEDKYLMIVNKPAGLVVHPGHGNYHGTLVNAIGDSRSGAPHRQRYLRFARYSKDTGRQNQSRHTVLQQNHQTTLSCIGMGNR